MNSDNKTEIRARQSFNFPIDPLFVTTMSDYDLSLILFPNWFDYDSDRNAKPDLISSWKFNALAERYEFMISPAARWSDGSSVTSSDIKSNLLRSIANGTTYGHALDAILNLASFTEVTFDEFTIQTKDRKPSDLLFQRLGTIFLALASPEDFPITTGRLKSNQKTCGPYALKSETPDELAFERNPHFAKRNPKGADSIKIRRPERSFDIIEFLNENTWENYVQLTTIIPPVAAKKLNDSGLPYWTRDHDRTSILTPVRSNGKLARRRRLLQLLAYELEHIEIPKSDLNVLRARCLQPEGYPLFDPVIFEPLEAPEEDDRSISIAAPANDYGEFHRQLILVLAAKADISVNWIAIEPPKFTSEFRAKADCDFVLMSFGVADPEPTTWMGLVFSDNNFISFDPEDKVEFQRIAALKSKAAEIADFKGLLRSIAKRGGYLPLLHFSTLSIGHRCLNFSNINQLDETVNFAKVIVESLASCARLFD